MEIATEQLQQIVKAYHPQVTLFKSWELIWGALRLADFAGWLDNPAKINTMQILHDECVEQAIRKLQTIEE